MFKIDNAYINAFNTYLHTIKSKHQNANISVLTEAMSHTKLFVSRPVVCAVPFSTEAEVTWLNLLLFHHYDEVTFHIAFRGELEVWFPA